MGDLVCGSSGNNEGVVSSVLLTGRSTEFFLGDFTEFKFDLHAEFVDLFHESSGLRNGSVLFGGTDPDFVTGDQEIETGLVFIVGLGEGFVEVDVSELEAAGESGVGLNFGVAKHLVVVTFLHEGGGFEFHLVLFDFLSLLVVENVEGFSFLGSMEVLDIFISEGFIESVFKGLLKILVLVGVTDANKVELLGRRVLEVEDDASAGVGESLGLGKFIGDLSQRRVFNG